MVQHRSLERTQHELDELLHACASCLDEFETEALEKRQHNAASNPAPVKRKFHPAKTGEDLATARIGAISKKTLSDTRYCFRVWNEWCLHRNENYGEIIPPIEEITIDNLSYHLRRFIL